MLQDENTEQAFEVEDIRERKNYTFHYKAQGYDWVLMFNTSRGSGNVLMCEFPKDTNKECTTKFPFGCTTAYEYFVHMYNKSLHDTEICFLGWVDTENYMPIEDY